MDSSEWIPRIWLEPLPGRPMRSPIVFLNPTSVTSLLSALLYWRWYDSSSISTRIRRTSKTHDSIPIKTSLFWAQTHQKPSISIIDTSKTLMKHSPFPLFRHYCAHRLVHCLAHRLSIARYCLMIIPILYSFIIVSCIVIRGVILGFVIILLSPIFVA
jgi:hypothetical protein